MSDSKRKDNTPKSSPTLSAASTTSASTGSSPRITPPGATPSTSPRISVTMPPLPPSAKYEESDEEKYKKSLVIIRTYVSKQTQAKDSAINITNLMKLLGGEQKINFSDIVREIQRLHEAHPTDIPFKTVVLGVAKKCVGDPAIFNLFGESIKSAARRGSSLMSESAIFNALGVNAADVIPRRDSLALPLNSAAKGTGTPPVSPRIVNPFDVVLTITNDDKINLYSLLADKKANAVKEALRTYLKAKFNEENLIFLEKLYATSKTSTELEKIVDKHIKKETSGKVADKKSALTEDFRMNLGDKFSAPLVQRVKEQPGTLALGHFTDFVREVGTLIQTNIVVGDPAAQILIKSIKEYHKAGLGRCVDECKLLLNFPDPTDNEKYLLAELKEAFKKIDEKYPDNFEKLHSDFKQLHGILKGMIEKKKEAKDEPIILDSKFLSLIKSIVEKNEKMNLELNLQKEPPASIKIILFSNLPKLPEANKLYHESTRQAVSHEITGVPPDILHTKIAIFREELQKSYKKSLAEDKEDSIKCKSHLILAKLVDGILNQLMTYKTTTPHKWNILKNLAVQVRDVCNQNPMDVEKSCEKLVESLRASAILCAGLDMSQRKMSESSAEGSSFVTALKNLAQEAETQNPALKAADDDERNDETSSLLPH